MYLDPFVFIYIIVLSALFVQWWAKRKVGEKYTVYIVLPLIALSVLVDVLVMYRCKITALIAHDVALLDSVATFLLPSLLMLSINVHALFSCGFALWPEVDMPKARRYLHVVWLLLSVLFLLVLVTFYVGATAFFPCVGY